MVRSRLHDQQRAARPHVRLHMRLQPYWDKAGQLKWQLR